MASTMFSAAPLSLSNQRTRNNSGGSTGSSVSSLDSDVSTPLTPLTPTTPMGLQMQDYQTIANLLSQNPSMQTEQVVKSLASRYKTELCRSFSETGICKYGDKCQFAHGTTEVKCLPRHPKYKSELCRTFHTSGFCPYGPRCHFIHSEDESKLTEINLMKQQAAARQATQQMLQQAARLRAQQQALQQQMQALVLSQMHLQIAQHHLTPAAPQTTTTTNTQRPVYYPQMSVPQQQQIKVTHTKPALDRTVSLPAASINNCTTNLGSVIDTPPITPPCGSPTFDVTTSYQQVPTVSNNKVVPPPPGFPPRAITNAANKPEIVSPTTTSACVNLDFSSNQNDALANDFNDIVSRLNSMELESVSSQSESLYTPSTSPDSMIQSPLDSPRGGRLPVFSQFRQFSADL